MTKIRKHIILIIDISNVDINELYCVNQLFLLREKMIGYREAEKMEQEVVKWRENSLKH